MAQTAAAAEEADSATDSGECKLLQTRLDAKLAENRVLQQELDRAASQKDAAHKAGLAGMKAAKMQLERLRAEMVAVTKWREAREQESSEEPWESEAKSSEEALNVPAGGVDVEESKTRAKALQIQVRSLRHSQGCLKYQVDCLEAKRPRQEDEILRLKAELVHTLDILEATRYTVRHHEVDRDFRMESAATKERDKDPSPGEVGLAGGGHGSIEAHAERCVREDVEGKNIRLSGKAKRLTGVVAAQQLLIQRLEKQLVKEEQQLERKDEQLYFQAHRLSQLKGMARKKSDSHVAQMVGVSMEQLSMRKASASKPSHELYQSASLPRLPAI
jgi:hypothetical protein